jgi:hypothetical protein
MSIFDKMLKRDNGKTSDSPDDGTTKHNVPSDKPESEPVTQLSPIDQISGQSLLSVVEKGAFHGLSDEQRRSATFRTGTVLGASVFELSKAFDPDMPEGESYKRGATGLIGLFEVAFSARKVLDGLQFHDRVVRAEKRDKRRKDSRDNPDSTNIGFDGAEDDEQE